MTRMASLAGTVYAAPRLSEHTMFAHLLIATALAQDPTLPAPPVPSTSQASPDLHRARGLKVTGQVLTGVGIAFVGFGAGLGVWGAASSSSCEFECMGPVFLGAGAALSTGVGVVFTAAGAPMWAVGARREHALSVAPAIGPQGGGFVLGGRF
jgi:hypothetical protein